MSEIVRDLGNRYGDLGSALVRHQGKLFVVSATTNPDESTETMAFPANAHGGITSWREVCGGREMTREQVIAALEDTCHCGAPLRGSDHCVVTGGCGCEQYETYCDGVYDPEQDYWDEDPVTRFGDGEVTDLTDEIARLRQELTGELEG